MSDVGADRLVVLGTGGGPPIHPDRSHPANAVVVDGRVYLVDSGLGVLSQLARAGIQPSWIRALLITHHHLDHVGGYPELMLLGQGLTGVAVYAPPPIAQMHADFLQAFAFPAGLMGNSRGAYRDGAVTVHELQVPGEGISTVFEDGCIRVTATRVFHTDRVANAYAYRIDRLQDGFGVVFSGDTTGPHPQLIELARGAAILVHEVQLDRLLPRVFEHAPPETHAFLREHFEGAHTDAADVPRVAAEAGVRTLVLNHYSPTLASREQIEAAVRDAAAAIRWAGEIIAPEDLHEILLDA